MAVLDPLRVEFTNWPEDRVEELTVENHPDHPEMGTRTVHFSRFAWIERDDFMEVPVKKFQRMYPGFEVRLKGAFIVRCDGCEKDADGNVVKVNCTVDMDSASGTPGADRKIKGKTLHFVSEADAVPFEARLYEPLLTDEAPDAGEETEGEEENASAGKKDFISRLNPDSMKVMRGYAEPCVRDCPVGTTFQFLRTGYFCKDPDSTEEVPVYNRTVGLRDTFAKQKG